MKMDVLILHQKKKNIMLGVIVFQKIEIRIYILFKSFLKFFIESSFLTHIKLINPDTYLIDLSFWINKRFVKQVYTKQVNDETRDTKGNLIYYLIR